MSSDITDDPKPATRTDSADATPGTASGSATDEDVLRLRSRLEREFALVTQKIVAAEESVADIELSVRSIESGSRSRLIAVSESGDKGSERITKRLKAVGEGFSKIKGWVSKQGDKEGGSADGAGASPGGADSRSAGRGAGDLEDRLDRTLALTDAEIRDREREVTDLDRRLHDAHKELIRLRTQEQHAREMQLKIGQTKQLSDDLQRQMSVLNDMVRSFEVGGKSPSAAASGPKDAAPAIPKIEERLQASVDSALKAVEAQEKKVQAMEKNLAQGNAALVEERTRQQRIRGMQIELRKVRHLSTDLQRSLSGLESLVDGLRTRAGALLRPAESSKREDTRMKVKPASEVAAARSGASKDSSGS